MRIPASNMITEQRFDPPQPSTTGPKFDYFEPVEFEILYQYCARERMSLVTTRIADIQQRYRLSTQGTTPLQFRLEVSNQAVECL
jgi:hypothetical protein